MVHVDIRIWNLFHDGRIVRIEGAVPGEVILSIRIDYLARLLVPPCALFLVHLQDCDLFELQSWADDSIFAALPAIEQTEPEILGRRGRGPRRRRLQRLHPSPPLHRRPRRPGPRRADRHRGDRGDRGEILDGVGEAGGGTAIAIASLYRRERGGEPISHRLQSYQGPSYFPT
jgi:hypothetical protein